jgi:hypothetical protein
MVVFTYGQRFRNPLGRKLGGPKSRSGPLEGREIYYLCPGIKPQILRVSVHSLVILLQRTEARKAVVALKHLFLKHGFYLR